MIFFKNLLECFLTKYSGSGFYIYKDLLVHTLKLLENDIP